MFANVSGVLYILKGVRFSRMLVYVAREKWESYGQSLYRLGFIKAFRFDPFLE